MQNRLCLWGCGSNVAMLDHDVRFNELKQRWFHKKCFDKNYGNYAENEIVLLDDVERFRADEEFGQLYNKFDFVILPNELKVSYSHNKLVPRNKKKLTLKKFVDCSVLNLVWKETLLKNNYIITKEELQRVSDRYTHEQAYDLMSSEQYFEPNLKKTIVYQQKIWNKNAFKTVENFKNKYLTNFTSERKVSFDTFTINTTQDDFEIKENVKKSNRKVVLKRMLDGDARDLKLVKSLFSAFLNKISVLGKLKDIKWVYVLEKQKRGVWHIHMVRDKQSGQIHDGACSAGIFKGKVINCQKCTFVLTKYWKYGLVNSKRAVNLNKKNGKTLGLHEYLSKYLIKGMRVGDNFRMKRYSFSHNSEKVKKVTLVTSSNYNLFETEQPHWLYCGIVTDKEQIMVNTLMSNLARSKVIKYIWPKSPIEWNSPGGILDGKEVPTHLLNQEDLTDEDFFWLRVWKFYKKHNEKQALETLAFELYNDKNFAKRHFRECLIDKFAINNYEEDEVLKLMNYLSKLKTPEPPIIKLHGKDFVDVSLVSNLYMRAYNFQNWYDLFAGY